MKRNKGITLVALVVTIIVLLILAAVSINLVLGDNGIITRAKEAKSNTTLGKEKEFIEVATASAMLERDAQRLNENMIRKELENLVGVNNVEVTREADVIIVKYKETGNIYEIQDNGTYEKFEVYVDQTPGVLDGEGTEVNPYKIESIEDLIAFSVMTRGGDATLALSSSDFSGKYINLCTKLDFNMDSSYNNPNTKVYNNVLGHNEEDITLKEILTNGSGFISAGKFAGEFNGNDKSIKNLYINMNSSNNTSFITEVNNGVIKNLTIHGMIDGETTTLTGKFVGGIVGKSTSSTIENCTNKISMNIATSQSGIGGISGNTVDSTFLNCINQGEIIAVNGESVGGMTSSLSNSTVKRCKNEGVIQAKKWVGGMTGWNSNYSVIDECGNYANITGIYGIGGLAGISNSNGQVKTSVNKGEINGESRIGGIVGYVWQEKGLPDLIANCYNESEITGIASVGGITGWASDQRIFDCYNVGTVNGQEYDTGGIVGVLLWGQSYYYVGYLTNCYSYSTVNCPVDIYNTTGLVGFLKSGTIQNTFYLDKNNDMYKFTDYYMEANSNNTKVVTPEFYKENVKESEVYSRTFIKEQLTWGEFVSKDDLENNPYNVWKIDGKKHPTLYWE